MGTTGIKIEGVMSVELSLGQFSRLLNNPYREGVFSFTLKLDLAQVTHLWSGRVKSGRVE